MKTDLHLHTLYSDGVVNCEMLVQTIIENGIKLAAKTDHDTVEGNDIFEQLCGKNGIRFVEGVELSSHLTSELPGYDETYVVHILGYGFDREKMRSYCNAVSEKRQKSLQSIILSLQREGYEIDPMRIAVDGRVVDRTAIAKDLVYINAFADTRSAFDCKLNTPEYIRKSIFADNAQDIIQQIHRCGGLAIWAHPFDLARGRKVPINSDQVRRILESFVEWGLDGIETYYQKFSECEQEILHGLAVRFGLLESCGSDYHGRSQQEMEWLRSLPLDPQIERLKNALAIQ